MNEQLSLKQIAAEMQAVAEHIHAATPEQKATKLCQWSSAIAALGQGEAVYQIQNEDGDWFDEDKATYEWWAAREPRGTRILYTHAPQPVVLDWQQRCLDLGFKYWRAPDAHGVECTHDQALALLRDLLGVEVDFAAAPTPEAQPQGEGEVCDKALWQAIDEALKRSCESGAFNNIDEVIPWMLDRAAKLGATQPQASEAGQGVALNYAVVHKFAVDHGIDYNTLAKLVRDSVVATHTQEGR